MRKNIALAAALLSAGFAKAQDLCSNATPLCANNTIASTTFGASFAVNDPALSCGDLTVNNSVWYTVTAITTGTCTINVGQINNNPGLEMEVYSGTCGSLLSTGSCNSANGPGGSMNLTFAVTSGATYYVMVDGSAGNQEAFTILATSATNSIIGRPLPGFIPSTFSGCAPLSVFLLNTTALSGGTNIVYQWRIDGGSYINATGNDTTIVFATTGTHTVDLKVCNAECGCASATQFIDVEDLVSTITPPPSICQLVDVDFAGDAQYLPDPPFTPVNIVSWDWNFGDPGSGANNTANGQNVQHAFSDSGNFTVTLIVTSADCGIDTVTTVVHVNPKPTVTAGPDQFICEFNDATVAAVVTNAALPVTYQWSGVGIFACDTCSSTIVSGLTSGGPYPISIHVDDSNGCFSDSSLNITVNPKPAVDLGNDTTVCRYSSLQLNANVVTGTPPFTYSWSPVAGLNNSTIQNPIAFISAPVVYCVLVQDSIGCTSDSACLNIDLNPLPSISAAPALLCATDPNPQTILTVNGAGAGSAYSWPLSPNYSLISAANADSSSVTISFPSGVAATYNFTCIVTDGVTGCRDTISYSYVIVSGLIMVVTIPPEACLGIPATISASGANTYVWSANPSYAFADSTLATQPVSPLVTTIFTVTGTVGTCTQVVSGTMNVYPRPTITVSNDTTVCPNTPVQIFSNASGGTPPYFYAWSPAAGLNDSLLQNPIATISAPATYCAAVVDIHSCFSDSQCVTMNVYPPPSVSAAPATLCASTPNPQTVFTVSGAAAGSSYSWGSSVNYSLITAANVDSSAVTVSLPPNSTATYSFTVVVTDGTTGCINTLQQTFTMTPGLNMTVGGPAVVCEGDSATLTVSGAVTYFWSASPAYPFADSTAASQTVSPAVTTVFTITGTTPGCSQVISYTLSVNAKPDAVTSPIPLFCGCATVNLSGILSTPGMNYDWTSTAGNVVTNPNLVNATSAICASDSFVLIVTDTTTGCSDTASAVADRNPLPDAYASVAPDIICDANPVTVLLDGVGSNGDPGTVYLWTSNNPSAIYADSTSIITTATISIATVFYLTVTDSLGCDSTYSDTVSVYPTSSISASSPFICTSDPTLQSTINITGAGAGSSYVWDTIPACVTPNTASTSSQVFDFTSCGAGIYNFSILVTDGVTGCTKRMSQTVTVVTGVTLVVSSDPVICEGDSTTLTVSGANTFLWSPGGDTTVSVNVTGLTSAGSPYQYIVTGTINTCAASDTITVTVNPTPATSPIAGPAVTCDSALGQVYSVTPPGGNYTWSVTNGTIVLGQGTDSITVNWDSAGTGTVSVVDTNAFGCPGIPQTISVTINPLPVTSAMTGQDSVCENSMAAYFVTPNAGSTYNWSVTNGLFIGASTGNVVNVQWGSAGTGTLQVNEVNAVGCAGNIVLMTVNIFPVPAMPAISGAAMVCAGDTMQVYSSPLIGGTTYIWTVIAGTIMSGINTDSISVNWDTAATGSINLVVINQYGCASPVGNISVTINPLPDASVTPDTVSLCRNIPLQLTGTTNFGTIQWTTSGNGTFSDTAAASPVYFPGLTDSGIVNLTMVLSSLTCGNDTAHVVLTVVPAPNTVITAFPDTICWGSISAVTAAGGGTYFWLNDSSVVPALFVHPLADSVFTVIVNNSYNCPDTDSITVFVIPPGIPNAGADLTSCLGDSIALNGSVVNAGQIYWNTLGDGTFSDSTQLITYYFPGVNDTTAGSASIVAYATGACINFTDTVLVSFSHPPFAFTGPDTLISDGNGSGVTIPLSTTTGYTTTVHFTTTGTGNFSPNDSDVTGVYIPSAEDYGLDSVVITVTATGPCGTTTDYFVIEFTPFTVPNVFTPFPSSPGYNDFFAIKNIPPGSKLTVWDRWGLLVYTSEDYQNDWDAHGLEADVFYYILETRQRNFHGWVRVFRGE
jgi:hypothetical protein